MGEKKDNKKMIFLLFNYFFLIMFLTFCCLIQCYGEVPPSDGDSKGYVYVKTRNAVMKDNQGHTILRLYAPNKIRIIDSSNKDKLPVEATGWISEYFIRKVDNKTYKANSDTILERLWRSPDSISWYYESIGEITDATVMIALGENYTSKTRDLVPYRHHKKESEWKEQSVYFKVKVIGWIEKKFITNNFDDTKKEGEISGRLLCKGKPAAGIPVNLGYATHANTVIEQETDEKGCYKFSELTPNIEYKLQFYFEEQWLENMLNLPVLDPGEKLQFPDMDICRR